MRKIFTFLQVMTVRPIQNPSAFRKLIPFGLVCILLNSTAVAEPTATELDALKGCPYDSATFKAATGLGMKWLKPMTDTFEGITTVTCRGIGDGNNAYAFIVQEWADAKTASKRFAAALQLQGRGGEVLAGDADKAIYIANAGIKSYSLIYVRGNVMTKVTVSSPPKESIAGLKEGLKSLRRLP
jgi:hypothetical protein